MNGFFNLNTHNFDSCFIMATIHDGRVVKKKSSFNQLFELKTKLGNRLLLPARYLSNEKAKNSTIY